MRSAFDAPRQLVAHSTSGFPATSFAIQTGARRVDLAPIASAKAGLHSLAVAGSSSTTSM
ncbi:MAG: hypothetical protein M3312_05635 [Actinomycetota bacterium]|nr:hypothetical protein [Actinomycetota bacterium]